MDIKDLLPAEFAKIMYEICLTNKKDIANFKNIISFLVESRESDIAFLKKEIANLKTEIHKIKNKGVDE